MARQDISVPLTVYLRKETVAKYEEAAKGAPLAEYLSNRTKLTLENIADGGMVLSLDQVEAIEKATGKPVRNGKDVVAAAQRGVDIDEGQNVIKWKIDPAFMDAIKIRAQECGRPVNDLFTDMCDIALENQWIFGVDPVGFRRTFTPAQIERISDLIGKDTFEVDDLIDALSRVMQEA